MRRPLKTVKITAKLIVVLAAQRYLRKQFICQGRFSEAKQVYKVHNKRNSPTSKSNRQITFATSRYIASEHA